MAKLNIKSFAIGFGSAFGLGAFFLGIVSMFGWGTALIEPISSLYVGFAPTIMGSIIGGIWGFIDGAIGGLIIAFVYNLVIKK